MEHKKLTHLKELEAESIYIIREVAAQFGRPALLFSGGKDSIVMAHLTYKAFYPAVIPFPFVHIDTGHNFEETITYRDELVKQLKAKLIVGSVEEYGFDAALGGARRDEEKARAKERFFSHRDEFGQWDPKNQRPELWNIFNGKKKEGEHFRIFPISNWTEMDVWQYILHENIVLPSLYYTHEREVFERDGSIYAALSAIPRKPGEKVKMKSVRCRTIGDITCTGLTLSTANTLEEIINEIKTIQSNSLSDTVNKSSAGFPDIELLRFSIAGSVDDGKSTLIGRLLYDSKSIFEDQLNAVREASDRMGNEEINLALLTDGLRAEREQGITIDVAYRYFATPKRKFIIADTPGHIEYTRNMVTGASTSDVAIILIDARNGIVEQTKRHAYIASLLQIPNVILAINKMDLVNFSEEIYEAIQDEFEEIAEKLKLRKICFIPISAKNGDNIVDTSVNTPWYHGETLLSLLENIPVHNKDSELNPRFPVQYVIESADGFAGYKGFAGRISGGFFSVGDNVLAIPSNRVSIIKAIDEGPVSLSRAITPQSVTICLEGDLDIRRGDMIVRINRNYPKYSSVITLQVCWLNVKPLSIGKKYIIRHTTDETVAVVTAIRYKVNINTLDNITGVENILMNDIAHITIKTFKPLKYDDYKDNRMTGSLILIDENTFETVGAGMIVTDEEVYSYNI